MSTSDDFHDDYGAEEKSIQFEIVAIFQLIIAAIAGFFGGFIVFSHFGNIFLPIFQIPVFLPEEFVLWGLQGLLTLVIAYVCFSMFNAMSEYDMWAYSTSMYANIFLVVIFLSIGPLGVIPAIVSFIAIILLFQPDVKEYWFPNFREDLAPRVKETKFSLHLVRKSPLVVVGIVVLVSFVVLAFLAPYISPYGPEERDWADINLPPGAPSNTPGNPDHPWGTDDSGGDIFSRIFYGAQIDLRISLTVVLVAVTFGTLVGAVAGYYGGKIDELVMRVTDVFFAFPGLILAMAIVMALGERSLDNISIALMVTWWPGYARLVRGQVLSEREKLYVEAARSVGASDGRILLVHIIPNTIQPLIVQATMDTGSVLLVAAGLSFIGFGPPAGIAEWGLMISIGQNYFLVAPWAVFYPGIAILLVALSFNLVGDGIRDIMDPKLRRR